MRPASRNGGRDTGLSGGWELRGHGRLHVFEELSELGRVQTGGGGAEFR